MNLTKFEGKTSPELSAEHSLLITKSIRQQIKRKFQ